MVGPVNFLIPVRAVSHSDTSRYPAFRLPAPKFRMHEFAPIQSISGDVGRFGDPSQPSGTLDAQCVPSGDGVAGNFVHSRGTRYRIRSVDQHSDCRSFSLVGVGRSTEAIVLLTPFDRIVPARTVPAWKRVAPLTVATTVAHAALEALGYPGLARIAARTPHLEVLAWQLEAARLLREGHATRLLIADDVGLGKTIQAALVHVALSDDRARDRTLILVPSGLRDQWCAELERLFAVRATAVDSAYLKRTRRWMPPSVNPWGIPGVFIAAIDFVKQPEVLAGLLDVRWSLVVLDEAHGLVGHTDRHRAAQLIARTSRFVVMLSATPHPGNAVAFEQLQRIGGAADDRLVVVRRTRADVGLFAHRRSVMLKVRPTPAERRLQSSLRAYLKRLFRERVMAAEGAQLMAWVLMKRAASSCHALRLTLRRRRDALVGETPACRQGALPFGIDSGDMQIEDSWLPAAVDAPGLRDRESEVALLDALIAEASDATVDERKLAAVTRLIARANQPAIVFTEFRDTLERVVQQLSTMGTVALHGGMDRSERRSSEHAFATGAANVLVATDAASEGLNLQARCRLVISLDVPWNPTRLEQRVGRVDRIGQMRTVHAVTVTSGAGDPLLIQRLERKLERIRHDLARAASDVSGFQHLPTETAPPSSSCASSAVRLLRTLAARRSARTATDGVRLPWAELSPAMRLRVGLPAGVLIFFGVEAWTMGGMQAAASCIPVLIELTPGTAVRFSGKRLIESCVAIAAPFAAASAEAALATGVAAHVRRTSALIRRVAAALPREAPTTAPYQPGLFDRRAITYALDLRSRDERRRADIRDTLARLDCDRAIESIDRVRPVAAFVLR